MIKKSKGLSGSDKLQSFRSEITTEGIDRSYNQIGFFDDMPWWVKTIFIILVLWIVFVLVFTWGKRCEAYDDLCYYRYCYSTGKYYSCTDKPITCSDERVIGHKTFCTQVSYWWERP